MSKNGVHPGAIICFALATVFYLIAWFPAAWGFGILALLIEVVGWILLWLGPDDDEFIPPRR